MTAAPLVVAIDGPAGSGKSTVAARLAQRLGLPHVDTGAYYRAATLAVLRAGVDPADGAGCAAVAGRASISRAGGRTLLDGEDVEAEIRGQPVTAAVSAVSAHPEVRTRMVGLQRAEVGQDGGVVEGRDAGTVVVPGAPLKVWLTAGRRVRAERRAAQRGRSDAATVAAQEGDIARRDAEDAAHMVPAPDAVRLDTTGRDVDGIVDELARLAHAAAAARPAGPGG